MKYRLKEIIRELELADWTRAKALVQEANKILDQLPPSCREMSRDSWNRVVVEGLDADGHHLFHLLLRQVPEEAYIQRLKQRDAGLVRIIVWEDGEQRQTWRYSNLHGRDQFVLVSPDEDAEVP